MRWRIVLESGRALFDGKAMQRSSPVSISWITTQVIRRRSPRVREWHRFPGPRAANGGRPIVLDIASWDYRGIKKCQLPRCALGVTDMSTIAPAQPTTSAVPLTLPDLYRINVHEYERMVAAGVLEDERIELIDGYMVKKMPRNPPHSWSTRRILDMVAGFLPPGSLWRLEQPVRIPDFDEPEPDVALSGKP